MLTYHMYIHVSYVIIKSIYLSIYLFVYTVFNVKVIAYLRKDEIIFKLSIELKISQEMLILKTNFTIANLKE